MPRRAREKNTYAVYHVISRSISEIMLFIDNADKVYYLNLLKRYLEKYRCSLYAYCLMSNHIHLHLDTRGFDISTFMHSVNTAYVRYFNKKYDRHGHLFQGRFGSRILYNDAYNLAVSAYIHNNPKDMAEYSGHEEDYEFSSYGIYLNTMPDYYGIIDKSFVVGLFNGMGHVNFAKSYHEFVKLRKGNVDMPYRSDTLAASNISAVSDKLEGPGTSDISDASVTSNISDTSNTSDKLNISDILPVENECEYISGRTVIIRENAAENVISYISEKLETRHQTSLGLKTRRKLVKYRALVAYSLRVLCNLSYKNICNYLVNISISSCSRLCNKGYELVSNDIVHLKIFNELVQNAA